uniref:Transposase Tc1-like domain-containing protein n=1 Tax=Amphiprion percula TaxID=161767 RepID=A0A3P8SVC9_AMPPE
MGKSEELSKKVNMEPFQCSYRSQNHQTVKKQAHHGTTKLLAGLDRKRLSTPRDVHALVCSCVRNRRQTSRDLKNEWALSRNVTCLARTVGNRLCETALKSHWTRKKPFINERERKPGLLFAGDHKDWTNERTFLQLLNNK